MIQFYIGATANDGTGDPLRAAFDGVNFNFTYTQNELNLRAPLLNPIFTGTVSGISKSMVGLSNVDNTSDINKPVSNATSTALGGKANLTGPSFTGKIYSRNYTGYSLYERSWNSGVDSVLTIQSENDSNPYSIVEIQATKLNPLEATLALLLPPIGASTQYRFIDLSVLNYDSDPRAVLVVQSRDVPLYPFKIAFSDGAETYAAFNFNPDGAFRLHNEKLTNNRRIELGDYGILQDYVRGGSYDFASTRATSFSFNSYLSNPVTGEYTKMNQYVNPLKMEMNGDGNILFKYSYTNGSSMTFSESEFFNVVTINDSGLRAASLGIYGGLSNGFLKADGTVDYVRYAYLSELTTTHFHIAYANSSNGTLDFSTTDPVGRRYIGSYIDGVEADSTNPLLYVWSLYVGANGATGSTGATGAPGSNGIDAQYVIVTGEQAFKFLSGSTQSTSLNITLTAVLSGGLTTYDWEYWSGSAWTNLSGTQNASTYSLLFNNVAWTTTSLRVRCLSGAKFDEITIVKLYDGTVGSNGINGSTGATGSTGASGSDGYTIILTNESHSLPVNGGVVNYQGSGTGVKVYKGTTKLVGTLGAATLGQYSITTQVLLGTLTIGTASISNNDIIYGDHSGAGTTPILVNYRIIIGDTSVFVDKVQSLSRVTSGETGAAGAAGTNGSNGLKTTTGYLYYQLSQLNAPATPSASTYTFLSFGFIGLSANWSTMPPTAAAGGKYWVSVFNVTESTPGSNGGTPVFSTPGNSATFTDVVSFSNLSTAGQTVIDGSNMTTGTIKSGNFVTGIAPYSTSGTLIDLTNGSIISKNFGIDTSGTATFRGSMVGGSINIGGGNFTVDSNGNVGVASSINLSAGGDLTFGTNGSITAQYWGGNAQTLYLKEGVADNSGNNNNLPAGLLSFDNGSSLISIYSWRTINIGGSSTYEFYNKSRGSFLWYANGGTTNRMIFGANNTGNLTCTGTITQNFSDERLKTKIGNIPYALDKINSLNGFTYYNNDLCKSFGFVGDEALVGVSAQEVQEVLPEAVKPAPFDTLNGISESGENYLTVQYEMLVPLLIEGIKELSVKVDRLENEIKRYKNI